MDRLATGAAGVSPFPPSILAAPGASSQVNAVPSLTPMPEPRSQADRAALVDAQVKSAAKDMMQAGLGPKWFAAALGKALAHETLLNKFNLHGEKQLHARELWEVLLLGDARPVLDVLCRAFGGVYVPDVHVQDGGESVERLLLIAAKELGDVVAAFLAATDPRGPGGEAITDAEWEEIERRLREGVQAFYRIKRARERGAADG